MFKAKISVKYFDDWSIDLVEEFNCELEFVYNQNVENKKILDLLKIKKLDLKDEKFSSLVVEFFKSYNEIVEVEILEESLEYLYLKVVTKMSFSSNNENFVKHSCFQLGTLKFEEKSEIWEFFTNKKENVKNLIFDLKKDKKREVKLLSLKNFNFEYSDLTKIQFEYLDFLFEKGYFEIPKKINLDEASLILNTSKTNLNKHINRALKKIVSSILKK